MVKEWTLAVYSAPSRFARTRLFGEDDGNAAEMLRGNGSNTDAGRLDGNDFGDGRSVETAAEFTPDLIQQRHIHLVVEKAIHLEYAAFFHLPVPQDPLF